MQVYAHINQVIINVGIRVQCRSPSRALSDAT